ncbi:Receptor-like protein 6 [Linum perenne]
MSLLSLVPLILPVLIVSSHVPLVSGRCREDQQSLLLQLKRGLNFTDSEYSKLARWNASTDCCEWPGISCDPGGLGRVIGLDLSREWITGGGGLDDSTALFSLQYLESLDLSNNEFNTTIPAAIGNLTNLRYLYLSSAGFFGKIPTSISQLTSLISLDLSCWDPKLKISSQLTSLTSLNLSCLDCDPRLKISNLGLLVQNLTQLIDLRLNGTDLSAEGKEWGHVLSSSLPNLKVLSLANCSLSGPLDPSISKLQSLSILELDDNNFSSPIPNSLAELKNLTLLRLRNCELIGTFPQKIAQSLTLLEILDLSNNHLQGPIPRSLFELPSFCILLLSSNRFRGRTFPELGNLSELGGLDLSDNNINGVVPRWVMESTTLKYLSLSHNNLVGFEVHYFSSSVLELLDMHDNQLEGIIPTSICNLDNLEVVDFSNNNLNGTIPSCLSKDLNHLSVLDLGGNMLSGKIPDTFQASCALQTLDLSNNQLEGRIPKSLENCTKLEVLDVGNNKISGPIPRSLFELPSLYILYLSDNNLTVDASINNSSPSSTFSQLETVHLRSCKLRTFPELGNLTKLSELDLSDNNINGVVPRWIIESTTLVQLNFSHNNLVGFEVHRFSSSNFSMLDMHDNQFEGNLPFIPSLYFLDISHNHFSGSFPTEIFNNQYTHLIFLSLSNNRLTGTIPTSICNASFLEVVDFSNNYLNGTIPSCLSKDLNGLSVLDLRGNMLSGKIPDTFQVSCALQSLDLSNNQLEGRFPESLENCTNLEVLDVGYNKISDVFPCIQGIKSSLHVLILRNNLFHGSLWCTYGDLTTWKQLQIVDLAFNNFSGPLNDKFLLTWEAMMQDRKETNDIIHFQTQRSGEYYRNSITVSMKGLELELVKILTIFKSIDLSSNNFDGPIPEVIGKFKAIEVLNLSHNAFSGEIPSEFGNLSNVESLDLSHNKLTGKIPNELTGLTFLSCMDLSGNNLVGRIPTGTQFQSFDNTSFGGNLDLCGQPLSKSCTDPPALSGIIVSHEKSSIIINWDILSKVFGFFCGLALIMLPASLWPSFRIWYWPKIDSVILWMFPKLYVKDWNNRLRTRQTRRRNKRTKATK